MDNHNTIPTKSRPISEAEQMYLLTTAKLVESGITEPVPLTALAQALAIQPVSANQMVHSLAESGLLDYLPYKGVQLTPAGRGHALRVLRYRRLWETFLVEHLGLGPDAADSIACEFEHATTEDAARALAEYLGNPQTSPQGLPIPAAPLPIEAQPLSSLRPGDQAVIVSLPDDLSAASFLRSQGLHAGTPVIPLAAGMEGDLLVKTATGTIHLSGSLAKLITCHLTTPAQEPHRA
jgi:DtxR family transcriptional regulator, Mn-dependent transcriptional regulator